MARSFNGTSDIISMGQPAALDLISALTLSTWIYPTALPASGPNNVEFMEKGYDGTNQQYIFRFDGQNIDGTTGLWLECFQFATGASTGVYLAFGGSVNNWYHVLGGWDGSGWNVYLNGSNAGQTRTASQAPPSHAAANFSLGAGFISGSPARFFQGRMAESAVWNVALKQGEITALARGALPSTIRPQSLAGYWPLNGLSSPEPDFSGNKNNGTLTGTALAAGAPVMMFTPRQPLVIPGAAAAAAGSVVFRRSLSSIGTRVGSRQAVQ